MLLHVLSLIAVLVLSLQSSVAATSPELPMPKGVLPVTAVHLAKAPPDSCGRGCDGWIAVEAKIDTAAAARLRSFLRKQKVMEVGTVPAGKDTKPPVRETVLSTEGLSKAVDALSQSCRG